MTRKPIYFLDVALLVFLLMILIQCNQDSQSTTVKVYPEDPFKKTIISSQRFELNSRQDNVIEGDEGTVVILPKGCFKNADGEVVESKITIELSEALSIDAMILSNLTTTSNGKLLQTGGMIYGHL